MAELLHKILPEGAGNEVSEGFLDVHRGFYIWKGGLVMKERAKRKLSAILSADVVGYSRLMGEDELATVRTLETYRAMITELICEYRGRVANSARTLSQPRLLPC